MSRFQASRQFERTPRVSRDDPEPSIRDELLADPALQLLMARDGAAAAFQATAFAECRA